MSGRRAKEQRRQRRSETPARPTPWLAMSALVAYAATSGSATHLQAQETTVSSTRPRSGKQQLPVRRFAIAPGPLETALQMFEQTTGVDVELRIDAELLRELHSPGASGHMSPEQALRDLLEATGVSYRFTSRNTAVIEVTASDAIDVRSTIPAVSSPKYTEPLRDTPQTISVITNEVIVEQGATTLRDILRNTPGITYQAGEGGAVPGDRLTIRGFSATNDILIDGVRDSGAYSRDAFNLEQVEVAKGPASVIGGRGTTGGAINLVTKTPHSEPFQRITLSAGTEDYSRATIDMNQPVAVLGGAPLRLNAMWSRGGVAGRDVVENDGWGIAPSLSLDLGGTARLTLAWMHLEQNNVPDYGLPWAALDARVDQSNFYGLRDYDYEDVSADSGTVTFESAFDNGHTLRNLARYSSTSRDSAITAPRPPRRQLQQRLLETEMLTNQTSLRGSLGDGLVTHAWVTGVELSRETTATRRQAQTTNQPEVEIEEPNPDDLPLGPMPQNAGDPGTTRLALAGIYAMDTIKVGERWQFAAGLRFDHIDIDYEALTVDTGARTEISKSEEMLSWRAGAVYKPHSKGSIYASLSTSFDPSVEAGGAGAALSTSPTAVNHPNLEPEESHILELGTKWDVLGDRLALAGAIFRTDKTNARTRTASNEPYVLDGQQRVEGVEVSVSGDLSDRVSAFAAYTRMRSEFLESRNPAEEGTDLPFIPENSLSIWTTAAMTPRLSVGGGVQYTDGVFRNSTSSATVPAYWLANAMASYSVNDSLTLRLNVNNATDEVYVDRVGGGHYIPGPRRSFVLNAELDF